MSLKNVKIVLTFFLLWVTTQFELEVENYFAYFFILSLGILHGSNDLKLMNTLDTASTSSYRKNLFFYLTTVLVTFLIFLIVPIIGLVLFVCISSYHFGEQHLAKKSFVQEKAKKAVYMLYGLLIFFMLFYTNFDEVFPIVEDVTTIALRQVYYEFTLISLLIVLTLVIVVFRTLKISPINIFEELLYLIVFYVLFVNSTLLWSFAIYFIVWHSLPSLIDQIQRLYGKVSVQTLHSYVKESFIYWIVSIVGIAALSFITKDDPKLFNLLFVALLAAITLPHVIILGKMHR